VPAGTDGPLREAVARVSVLLHPSESRRQRADWRRCRIRRGLTATTTARTTRLYFGIRWNTPKT